VHGRLRPPSIDLEDTDLAAARWLDQREVGWTAADREPDEAVDRSGDGQPAVQALGGSVAAEHDRINVLAPGGADLARST
jgi:hypothetical protein